MRAPSGLGVKFGLWVRALDDGMLAEVVDALGSELFVRGVSGAGCCFRIGTELAHRSKLPAPVPARFFAGPRPGSRVS